MKKKKRIIYSLTVLSLGLFSFSALHSKKELLKNKITPATTKPFTIIEDSLYNTMQLDNYGLSRSAFLYAIQGWSKLKEQGKIVNDKIISIIDFSLPSNKKRLFVIDVETMQVIFNTYVAHGRNSGVNVASNFSNKSNSYKSSLGFYITENVYSGKHGYSLKLNGEEKGFNDHAMQRGIVIHSANYVSEMAAQRGFIGRSQGCPAIPANIHKEIIDKIKQGSCLFIYADDKNYLSHSSFIQL